VGDREQEIFLAARSPSGAKFSDRTAQLVDEEVKRILTKRLRGGDPHLTERRKALDWLAAGAARARDAGP